MISTMRGVSAPAAFDLTTRSVEETRTLARALAELVEPADVLVLGGQLGAGKTAFTQGFGAALGVTDRIVSPTFTIERIYEGRVRLRHLDVYRLEHLHEALDLGLDEALDDGDVAVIEWGEAIAGVLGRDYLLLLLELGDADDDRLIRVVPQGDSWTTRSDALAVAVASVRDAGVDTVADRSAD